ncbi:MAG: alpha/beta hydrolase [Xanthobacteraceae bacterium]|nr:alpha/beta hydrolase [Xanthobacteraceae bacterium]QYK45047.1 MAG: alpha/beta hydrolase [Xanthobacteraceae bacterium]
MSSEPQFIDVGGRRIAIRAREGNTPGLFWLGGFKSDMKGTKAVALDAHAAQTGRACIRFDYSGHGESGGRFEDATISQWLEESLAVFGNRAKGPQIVIGSSMGGWMALLLARALAKDPSLAKDAKLAGLVLIAPAPDFTEELMWKQFSDEIRNQIETTGQWERPSVYGDPPYAITKKLIEDGRKHLLLGQPIEVKCPVRILQGVLDPDVPWQHAMRLVSCLAQDDVAMTLVKDGDHRLSRPEDIQRLLKTVDELAADA